MSASGTRRGEHVARAGRHNVSIVAALLVLVAVASWAYYSSAWQRSANSTSDDQCALRLRAFVAAVQAYYRAHQELPAAVRELRLLLSEPPCCPSEPHPEYMLLPDGTLICRNHHEPRPGWNLTYDEGGLVATPKGGIRRVSKSAIDRIIENAARPDSSAGGNKGR